MDIVSLIGGKSLDLVVGIAILLIGMVLGRFISKLVERLMSEVGLNRLLKKLFNTRWPLEQIISYIIKYIVYFVSVVMALNQIGLTSFIFNLVLMILFVFIVIFILIAIKDFIPNMLAGSALLKEGIINIGDRVDVANIKGKVIGITLMDTKIETKEGDVIWVPNGFLAKHIIKKR